MGNASFGGACEEIDRAVDVGVTDEFASSFPQLASRSFAACKLARNILQAWVPESTHAALGSCTSRYAPSDDGSGDDDSILVHASHRHRPTCEYTGGRKKRNHIRQIIASALGIRHDGDGRSAGIRSRRPLTPVPGAPSSAGVNPADPRVFMEARRCLARERKAQQDAERAAQLKQRLLQKDRRAQLRLLADKAQMDEDAAETVRIEASIRTAKEAVSLEVAEMRKQKDLEKKMKLEELQLEIEKQQKESELEFAAKAMLDEKQRRKDLAYTKVDEMCALNSLRCVHAHFSAWMRRVTAVKATLHQFQIVCTWKLCNKYWTAWKAARDRRTHKRTVEEAARELKFEHENTLRSLRHYRMAVRSHFFLRWSAWAKLQKEKRRLLQEHERRASRMAVVLQKARESLANVEPHTSNQKEENWDVEGADRDALPVPQPNCRPAQKGGAGQGENSQDGKSEAHVDVETREISGPSTLASPPIAEKPTGLTLKHCGRRHENRPRVIKTDTRLLQGMAQRELERQARKQAREQRLRERAEQQRREENERLKFQEEENERLRLEAIAKEKEEKEAIERDRLRGLELIRRAKEHSKRRVLRFFALQPWRRFVALQRKDADTADKKYTQYLIRVVGWGRLIQRVQAKDERVAQHAALRIMRGAWTSWKTSLRDRDLLCQHSCRIRNNQLTRRTFRTWQSRAKQEFLRKSQLEAAQNSKAEILAIKLVPRRFLRKWRGIHRTEKEERWHEYKRQVMREKVRGWLYNSRLQPEEEAGGGCHGFAAVE